MATKDEDLSNENDLNSKTGYNVSDFNQESDIWINSGIININNKSFVAGLFWESFDDSGHKKEAFKKAKEYNADLYIFRKIGSNRHQYGFSSSKIGCQKGMYSLASTIVRNLEDSDSSLLGVFKLDNGSYYIIAARDGYVLSGYDLLVNTETDAQNIFSSLYYDGSDWKNIVAPSSWSIDRSNELPITDFLIDFASKDKLLIASNSPLIKQVVIIGGIVVVLIVGYIQYSKHEAYVKQQAQEEALRQRALYEMTLKSKNSKPVEQAPPWIGQVTTIHEMDFCIDHILSTKTEVPGWQVLKLSCSGSSVSVSYVKTFGTLNWFGAALNQDDVKPNVSTTGQSNVIVTWNYNNNSPTYKISDKLNSIPLSDVYKYLDSTFGENFQDISLQLIPEVPIVTHTPHGDVTSPAQYGTMYFSFSTSQNPKIYEDIIKILPISSISNVELDFKNDNSLEWTIKGSAYEKIPVINKLQVSKPTLKKK